MLPSTAKPLGNVHVCVAHVHAEGMFSGRLEWKALSFEYYSFIAKFQELLIPAFICIGGN